MAKQELPVNFKDDILASSMVGKRRYLITQNEDESYSFEDVTDYTQLGSSLGAKQINEICQAINDSADKSRIIDNLDDIVANKTPGMIAGAQAVAALNAYLLQLQAHHNKKTLTPTDLGLNTGIWKVIVNNSCIIGKTVHLNMEIYTTATIVANNVYDNVFTIPSQYRPLNDTVVNVTASDGSYKNPVACTSMARTNGNLFICIPKATNSYLFIDAEWEIK
jgi:hypothetical protein